MSPCRASAAGEVRLEFRLQADSRVLRRSRLLPVMPRFSEAVRTVLTRVNAELRIGAPPRPCLRRSQLRSCTQGPRYGRHTPARLILQNEANPARDGKGSAGNWLRFSTAPSHFNLDPPNLKPALGLGSFCTNGLRPTVKSEATSMSLPPLTLETRCPHR